jgi:predicted nicotinamide N-methyase
MLCQRLDGEQMLISLGPFPVGRDLVPPEACPFPDELQGAGIEATGKYLAVHRDRGTPPAWWAWKWATG